MFRSPWEYVKALPAGPVRDQTLIKHAKTDANVDCPKGFLAEETYLWFRVCWELGASSSAGWPGLARP